MSMNEREICREYREAKNKKYQITILADQNCCKEEEIVRILLENGEELPKNKKKKALLKKEGTKEGGLTEEKATDEPPGSWKSMPEAVLNTLYARMDELDAEITVREKEYKEIAAFIGHYGGEVKTRTA